MKAVNKGLALQSDVHWRGRGQVDWKKGEVSRKLNSLEGLKQEQDLGVDSGISLWPRMRGLGNCCLSAFRMQRDDIFYGGWRKMAQDWRQHPVGN